MRGDPKYLNLRLEGDRARAKEALERLLASETFARSMQLRRFLQFTAKETLAGRSDDIKEYSMLAPSPELNRPVAVAMASGPRAGLESAETVQSRKYGQIASGDGSKTHLTNGQFPRRVFRQARKASMSSGDR